MKRSLILEVIIYLFILLFVYTALSKLFIYDVYIKDLRRSPDLKPFALALSFIIPISELLIAGLLMFKNTRLLGLYGSLILMVLFTVYVAYVLNSFDSYPCQCGGIIKELTWRQHIWFNIFFMVLAFIGVLLQRKQDHSRDNFKNEISYGSN